MFCYWEIINLWVVSVNLHHIIFPTTVLITAYDGSSDLNTHSDTPTPYHTHIVKPTTSTGSPNSSISRSPVTQLANQDCGQEVVLTTAVCQARVVYKGGGGSIVRLKHPCIEIKTQTYKKAQIRLD